jgi:hypothetical protein
MLYMQMPNMNNVMRMIIDNITTKCILVHYGFHYILSEFEHFYLLKLFNPLVNRDQLLRTMTYFINT